MSGPNKAGPEPGTPRPNDAALAEYRRRRDFTRTGEPAGGEASTSPEGDAIVGQRGRRVFVVQKHAASSLHYDLRLEVGGVLKSWAVPKGPSLDPADKRLAVMTEDHPLEYGAFEGIIPEGEYGAGTVMLWDLGWWEPDLAWMTESHSRKHPSPPGDFDPDAALASGELKLVIHGQKLAGSWALVHMKGRGANNWLLLKHRDDSARPGYDIVKEAPNSAATGRSLEEIASATRATNDSADRDSARDR